MNITKTIETAGGSVTFQGVLNAEELDLVISVGLNYLLQAGALPMKSITNLADAHKGVDTAQ